MVEGNDQGVQRSNEFKDIEKIQENSSKGIFKIYIGVDQALAKTGVVSLCVYDSAIQYVASKTVLCPANKNMNYFDRLHKSITDIFSAILDSYCLARDYGLKREREFYHTVIVMEQYAFSKFKYSQAISSLAEVTGALLYALKTTELFKSADYYKTNLMAARSKLLGKKLTKGRHNIDWYREIFRSNRFLEPFMDQFKTDDEFEAFLFAVYIAVQNGDVKLQGELL